ncbi:MAG: PLP-dependent aminotransferase family protein, partial [Thermodesulfobacteriota bacterium]
MTIWAPRPQTTPQPIYQAIVQALAQDVRAGRLKPGDRLPTHRDLADRMGVTVGTVTRAYKVAQSRGLLRGEVGRGTYVAGGEPETLPPHALPSPAADLIDLRLNVPPYAEDPDLGEVLRELAGRTDLAPLLWYLPAEGLLRHREAGAAWVRRAGLEAGPEDLVVCAGSQHALTVALITVAQAGDTVLAEELTYPGLKTLAGLLGLRLEPVALDEEGLIPEALEAACGRRPAKAVYLIPTLQNPTTAVMPEPRRRRVAELARKFDLVIIEDDVHRLLWPEAAPPVSGFAPERSFFIPGLSKTLAGGLRVAFMTVPGQLRAKAARNLAATIWFAPPLTVEIAATWIGNGTADRVIENKRREAAARQDLAAEILGPYLTRRQPAAYHLWLELPYPWRGQQFAAECTQAGVPVLPAEVFVVGQAPVPQAVRVSLSA